MSAPHPANTSEELRHAVANAMSDAHKSGHWSCEEKDCHKGGSPINKIMEAVADHDAKLYAALEAALPKKFTDVEGQHPDHTPEQLTRVTAMNRSYNQAIDQSHEAVRQVFNMKEEAE